MAETLILSLTPSDAPVSLGFRWEFSMILSRNVNFVATNLDPLRFRGV